MTEPDQRQMLNCGASGRVVFAYRCPLTWGALAETDDPRQRGCQSCRRTVYWCSNLADATVLAGWCLIFGAALPFVLVILFVLIINARFIRPEEQRLGEAFGDEFAAYASKVRRWI